MLQIFTASASFLLAGGALALIGTMLSADKDAIIGALRGASGEAATAPLWPSRVRLVSMPAPVSRRTPQRAYA